MMIRRSFLTLVAAALSAAAAASTAQAADVLYIGDGGDDTIKRYDADSGASAGAPLTVTGLLGPRGMVIDDGALLVVNQNVNTNFPGEILVYDGTTTALVPATSKDAPFVPRGLCLGLAGDLFVGNLSTASGKSHGQLLRYDAVTGQLIGVSKAGGIQNKDYHPRGVVFGPDGNLYVAVRDLKKDQQGGGVLRYDSEGRFLDVFIEDAGGVGQLNRPEGLVFGPDGNLYVTSFRAVPGDTDSIRIYDPDGDYLGQIDLHNGTTDARVFAEALLFGPEDKLFVPLNNTGEVRRYNSPTTGDYDVFIPAGGDLLSPWYMTFGKTDAVTLSYEGE